MKKSMLLAAMAAVAMTSCSNNEFDGVETEGNGLVKIEIGQKVQGIETKAAIATGDQVEATIIATPGETLDWGSFNPVMSNTFADGETTWDAGTFANVTTGTFEAGSEQAVGMNPTLYANPAAGTNGGARLTGIAPKGTVANGKVTFSLLDGQQDVMVAQTTDHQAVTGTGVNKTIAPFALTFDHMTAQLRFKVAAVNSTKNGAWESEAGSSDVLTVKSVTVKKNFVPQAVRLSENLPVIWTTVGQDFSLTNFTENAIPLTYDKENSKPNFVELDKVLMVKPGVGVELDVIITINGEDKSYKGIKPQAAGKELLTEVGKYHYISLTVKQPETPTGTPTITATATVTEWAAGDEGTAEL